MSGPARQDRFPLAPLLDGLPISVFATFTNTAPISLWRYQRDGVPRDAADRLAIARGRHPAEVWPDYHPKDAA